MTERFEWDAGSVEVMLPSPERELLAQVLVLLADVDGMPVEGDDPAKRRLNVPVYLDDETSNREWWRLMGQELEESRSHDREVYRRVMAGETSHLTEAEAGSVLRVLNEGRLAFAARLGLDVEEDHDRLPEAERNALDFLGWILEDLTLTLMDGL